MEHSEVVFMYAPEDPGLYDAYGASVVLWGGGKGAAIAARARGVRFQGSMWFLTAWGDALAKDPRLLQSVCVDIEGQPIEVPWLTDHKQAMPNYWGCTNAPYYRSYLRQRALDAVQDGADGLHIDDHAGTAACASYAGGCFCSHCTAGFREFLRAHVPPSRLSALGIEDIGSFDYGEYARKYANTRQAYIERRWSIPLFAAFMSFQVGAEAGLVGDIRAECEQALGHRISLSANCCMPEPLHLGDYMHLDTLCGEIALHAAEGRPSSRAHLAYKVADAIRRPLAATASGWDWAWIAEHNKPGLVKTWVAESYAFGHRLMAPHHQWAYTSQMGTHWWDCQTEQFAPLYKFVATHPELFDGYGPLHEAVLVFNSPAYYRGKDRSPEAAAFLAENSLQYRVAIAGGDWVPERIGLRELQGTTTVVCSDESLDERQREVLAQVEAAGDLVKWAGPQSWKNRRDRLVEVAGADGVWALVRRNDATSEAVVHLLNRDYDLRADDVRPTGPVRLGILRDALGIDSSMSVTLYSVPGLHQARLTPRVEGERVVVEVPEIGLWGIVHIAG